MTTLTASCDDCKKTITADEIYKDYYDDSDKCEKCYLIGEIKSKTRAADEKQKWIEQCHLKPLEEKREEIKKLKLRLKHIEEAEK